MNKYAIFHVVEPPYVYGVDDDNLIVRVRTAKNDINKCEVYYKSRYDWEKEYDVKKMKLSETTELFDFYETTIYLQDKRYRYMFKLTDKTGNSVYLNEKGLCSELKDPIEQWGFQFPFLNSADVYKGVKWAENSIVYQIMPDRFCNGDKSNDPKNVLKWGEKPTVSSMFGGDLKGIIDKLDYLEDLGINLIYLTPVFLSSTNHKYNTKDYYKIDDTFGDVDKAKELVQKCHERNIKIIFDAVFNHCGHDFFAFQDVIKNGERSKYKDWFFINEYPVNIKKVNYITFANEIFAMPKLNTENEEVKKYLLEVAEYWIKEVNIDGWRLDVCDEVDHSFWREFRKTVKKANPDAIIVGEIQHEACSWLKGEQLDSIMNYPFKNLSVDFFAKRKITAEDFDNQLASSRVMYMKKINLLLFNLIGSHDTPRFLYEANEKIERMLLAVVFQFTYVGMPYIYYGDEVGITGEQDPDCRRCMVWDEDKQNNELLDLHKKLIKIRKEEKTLVYGEYMSLYKYDNVLAFKRVLEGEEIIVILNNSDEFHKVNLKIGNLKCHNLISREEISINDCIDVKPNEYLILKVVK
ncbi:glycoside hydrolase family 13 protein [Clostridium guangxiense]|uniref:glycoside hydrolase family 13 protein n=2 Tax=Clostridium TaxID=1485 RepID=UPI001E2B541A|nr:glycoside hydrolase family 13 protein [Clostridium guangxiense]MCD2347312.1 alpha-glycosidase [Clostridium guangxiense]